MNPEREPLQVGGRVIYRAFGVGATIVDIRLVHLYLPTPLRYDVRADNGCYVRGLKAEDLEVLQ